MILKVKRQDALALFWIPQEGEIQFFSICCASGLMDILGRKVEKGEEFEVEINLKEVKSDSRGT